MDFPGTRAGERPVEPSAPPPGARPLALAILLASLTMVFGSGLLAYVAARTGSLGHIVPSAASLPRVSLPLWFWPSTFLLLVSSVTLHATYVASRDGKPRVANRAFLATTLLGWSFLVLQVPGLLDLVAAHRALADAHVLVYALVAFLVGLHAVHVLGGLAILTRIATGIRRRPIGTERLETVKLVAGYWHFMTLVWIVIFHTFLLVRGPGA